MDRDKIMNIFTISVFIVLIAFLLGLMVFGIKNSNASYKESEKKKRTYFFECLEKTNNNVEWCFDNKK